MELARFWGWITAQTLRGLLLLVPLLVTVVFVIWISGYIEQTLRPLILLVVPASWYIPGLALVLFLLAAFLLGVATRNVLMRKVGEVLEHWVERTPVIGRIYPVVRQLTDLLSGKNQSPGSRVVLVDVAGVEGRVFGIVLQQGGHGIAWLPDDCDLVYLPMSYQVGGYAVVLPRARLTPVDMSPGEALQMIVMGGLGQKAGSVNLAGAVPVVDPVSAESAAKQAK
jgi:uncharacterized membrane protein